jgi:hypothetical protein
MIELVHCVGYSASIVQDAWSTRYKKTFNLAEPNHTPTHAVLTFAVPEVSPCVCWWNFWTVSILQQVAIVCMDSMAHICSVAWGICSCTKITLVII